jgi:hypothetical protein
MPSLSFLKYWIFTVAAFASLLLLINYWIWVARTWIEIAPWRPDVMVSMGSWKFDALLGLPWAILPTLWVIERVIQKRRRRLRGFEVLQSRAA